MKNLIFPLGVCGGALALLVQPAHARGGGIIGDVIGLIQNAVDGTIPLPYVIGFGVLVLAIVLLGANEARKNARAAPPEESNSSESNSSVRLDK